MPSAHMAWKEAYKVQDDRNNYSDNDTDNEGSKEALLIKQGHCRRRGKDVAAGGCGVEGAGGWKVVSRREEWSGQ